MGGQDNRGSFGDPKAISTVKEHDKGDLILLLNFWKSSLSKYCSSTGNVAASILDCPTLVLPCHSTVSPVGLHFPHVSLRPRFPEPFASSAACFPLTYSLPSYGEAVNQGVSFDPLVVPVPGSPSDPVCVVKADRRRVTVAQIPAPQSNPSSITHPSISPPACRQLSVS